jgi:hypothetical protein
LEARLVPDTAESFTHFAQGGWEAVAEAFAASENIETFLSPAMLDGFVGDFLQGPYVPRELRRKVVEELSVYVDDDDVAGLEGAGRFALAERIWLPLEQVRRIAQATQDPSLVLRQLVHIRDLPQNVLVGVLVLLGAPYSQLGAGPGAEFNLPASQSAKTLLQRLEEAGRVKIVTRSFGFGRKVQVIA